MFHFLRDHSVALHFMSCHCTSIMFYFLTLPYITHPSAYSCLNILPCIPTSHVCITSLMFSSYSSIYLCMFVCLYIYVLLYVRFKPSVRRMSASSSIKHCMYASIHPFVDCLHRPAASGRKLRFRGLDRLQVGLTSS